MDLAFALLDAALRPSAASHDLGGKRWSDRAWQVALATLRVHRVDLLVAHAWRDQPAWADVPAERRAELETRLDASRCRETLFHAAFAGATAALARAELSAVACKGIVLSPDYYPAPGLRPMGDIDLWLESVEFERAIAVLHELGFWTEEPSSSVPMRVLHGPGGIAIDVHGRMELFEVAGHRLVDLSEPHRNGTCRRFLPEPLLVHLVVHMLGHVEQTGLMIGWMVDLLLVLRRHGSVLDWDFVAQLFPRNGSFEVLLRFVRFFVDHGWLEAPPRLASRLVEVPVLDPGLLLRQRRFAIWGMPSWRGWARWARSWWSPGLAKSRPSLSLHDLLHYPRDWLGEYTPWRHGAHAVLIPRAHLFRPQDFTSSSARRPPSEGE